jgi:Darcynin, domain of unknown function
MNYTILILVNATPQWLSLQRSERDHFVETELQPIFAKYGHSCNIRLFDSDFTNPGVSDFIIVETEDLKEFGFMMGYLRESKTFAAPYFDIKDLIVGVPNNFRGSLDIADIRG